MQIYIYIYIRRSVWEKGRSPWPLSSPLDSKRPRSASSALSALAVRAHVLRFQAPRMFRWFWMFFAEKVMFICIPGSNSWYGECIFLFTQLYPLPGRRRSQLRRAKLATRSERWVEWSADPKGRSNSHHPFPRLPHMSKGHSSTHVQGMTWMSKSCTLVYRKPKDSNHHDFILWFSPNNICLTKTFIYTTQTCQPSLHGLGRLR